MTSLQNQLSQLRSEAATNAVKGIQRGIEREALRICPEGKLSRQDHPQALGSALTHPYITTDYSESLMELITPPSNDIETTFNQLKDVHHYVLSHLGEQMLWPMSMPCFISNEDDIRIAQYGSSNVGKMKTTYRVGLKNRYGSMMQAISGIHYNFSLPTEFWQLLQQHEASTDDLQTFQSSKYMHMVRNIKRYVWVVTYLFGASPAMCKSFLQGRETGLNFESFGKGSIFLPNATSLRMSDLGYTNSAQSALNIEYGSLTDYIERLRQAIKTESDEYKNIGVKVDGQYKQLNHNILQIENELYAPVRPKQVAKSGEKPTDALERRGVMYVELRALDVNPFSPYGITLEQMRMLDIFLLFCLFNEQSELSQAQQQEAEANQDAVVLNGRDKTLAVTVNGETIAISDMMTSLFAEFEQIGQWLDGHYGGDDYQQAVAQFLPAASDAAQTLSGQLMTKLLDTQIDNGYMGIHLAEQYKADILAAEPKEFGTDFLSRASVQSHEEQRQVEQNDSVDFDEFLQSYFAQ